MRLELKKRPRNKAFILGYLRMGVIFTITAGILIFLFSCFGIRSEMLREVAQSELESIAYDIVGRVAEEEISRFGESFGDVINVVKDDNGKISGITTDMQLVNLLKLRIANRLSEEMLARTEDSIKIPLGNLTGIDFLTGVGPDMKFRVLWVSSVDSNFSNSFEAVGINQTIHRVMLDFSINVGMMFIGREIGVDVGADVCVAETVIVAEVPDYFFEK